jgi:K+-transporting ATPase KdpF subunit
MNVELIIVAVVSFLLLIYLFWTLLRPEMF